MARTFTIGEVETALCLWEAFIEMQGETDPETKLSTEFAEQLCELRSQHGSFTVRHAIMSLVDDAEIAWQALNAIGDHVCFDYEFCPAFLRGKIESGDLGIATENQWRVVA